MENTGGTGEKSANTQSAILQFQAVCQAKGQTIDDQCLLSYEDAYHALKQTFHTLHGKTEIDLDDFEEAAFEVGGNEVNEYVSQGVFLTVFEKLWTPNISDGQEKKNLEKELRRIFRSQGRLRVPDSRAIRLFVTASKKSKNEKLKAFSSTSKDTLKNIVKKWDENGDKKVDEEEFVTGILECVYNE